MTASICEHLERKLPQMRHKKLQIVDCVQFTQDVFALQNPVHDLEVFLTSMRDFGFTKPWDLDLLSARYFYRMSLRRIEKEFDYVSFMTVKRRLAELHALLKERGYGQGKIK